MSLLKKKDLELSFRQKLRDMMLGDELMEDLDRIYLPMANLIKMGLNTQNRTQVIGINGAQGAGIVPLSMKKMHIDCLWSWRYIWE